MPTRQPLTVPYWRIVAFECVYGMARKKRILTTISQKRAKYFTRYRVTTRRRCCRISSGEFDANQLLSLRGKELTVKIGQHSVRLTRATVHLGEGRALYCE